MGNTFNIYLEDYSKKPGQEPRGKKTIRGRSKDKKQWVTVDPAQKDKEAQKSLSPSPIPPVSIQAVTIQSVTSNQSKLGTAKDQARDETSATPYYLSYVLPRSNSAISRSSQSDVQPDSSDVESSESELEHGEFSKHEPDFEFVQNKKKFSGLKKSRGKGSKTYYFLCRQTFFSGMYEV